MSILNYPNVWLLMPSRCVFFFNNFHQSTHLSIAVCCLSPITVNIRNHGAPSDRVCLLKLAHACASVQSTFLRGNCLFEDTNTLEFSCGCVWIVHNCSGLYALCNVTFIESAFKQPPSTWLKVGTVRRIGPVCWTVALMPPSLLFLLKIDHACPPKMKSSN